MEVCKWYLKQHCVEVGTLCDWAPPTVSECIATVVNTNPRFVTICQALHNVALNHPEEGVLGNSINQYQVGEQEKGESQLNLSDLFFFAAEE